MSLEKAKELSAAVEQGSSRKSGRSIVATVVDKVKDLVGTRKCIECGRPASKAFSGEVDGVQYDLYRCINETQPSDNRSTLGVTVYGCRATYFGVRRDNGHLMAPFWLRRAQEPIGDDKVRAILAEWFRDREQDRKQRESINGRQVVCPNKDCRRFGLEARYDRHAEGDEQFCYACGSEHKRRSELPKEGGR